MAYNNEWLRAFFGGHEYPYTDSQRYNDDWILAIIMKLVEEFNNFANLNKIKYADPISWDITRQYEGNTVVVDARTGNAYISSKPVPRGVQIDNTYYWTEIYNYARVIDRLRNQIAHNEGDRTTASREYEIGQLVFVSGELYKIIAHMIAGDSFVIDSNISKTTIEEEIANLIAADSQLLETINNETDARIDADNLLQQNINDEAAARTIADDLLQQNIDLLHSYVSVLDYGAVGDSVTDDTAAFQEALDSGKHVFIPVAKGQKYLITDTLNITTWQQVIFSEFKNSGAGYQNLSNDLPLGAIYFNPSSPKPLFNGIGVTGTKFYNINANSPCTQTSSSTVTCANGFYVGSFGEVGQRANDLDVVINNCFLFGFKIAIDATGRGVDVQNCWFADCETPVRLSWIDQTGQSYLIDNETGMRNIIIKNNRFHCINSYCVVVNGSCQPNGMEICDNVSDMGGANFLLANQATLRNCKIIGNIIKHTINSTTPPIYIYKVLGCNIENNIFYNNADYGDFRCTRIIHVGNGTSKSQGLVISNNRINYSLNDIITLQDVNDAVISNNQLSAIHSSDTQQLAAIVNIVGGTFDRISIVSNSVEFKTATNYVLRSSIAISENTMRWCRIGFNAGNYGSVMDAQHDWSVLSATNEISR